MSYSAFTLIGLGLSAIAFIMYFDVYKEERRNGEFHRSRMLVILWAIITLIVYFWVASLFIEALDYLQNPPESRWIIMTPFEIFYSYFLLSLVPAVCVLLLMTIAYHFERRRQN